MSPINRILGTVLTMVIVVGCAKGNQGGDVDASSPNPIDAGPNQTFDASCGAFCDADNDGVPDGDDLCPDTPAGEPVNQDGCADSQLTATLEPEFPPYGLTWIESGNVGLAGGVTWTYTAITRGDLFHIYWVLCDDPATPCGISMDGPLDNPTTEYYQYSAADSDPTNGILVFTHTPQILLADSTTPTVNGRLTVTITDLNDVPIPAADIATLGFTPRTAQAGVEIPDTAFRVNMIAEMDDNGTWVPSQDYFNAAPTPDGAEVYTSVSGFFYSK